MRIRTHTNPLSYNYRFKKLNELLTSMQAPGSKSGAGSPSCPGRHSHLGDGGTSLIDFEIGFGQESFILDYAQQNPTRLIVGAEVRKLAVELLHEKIAEQHITNVLALHGNGHMCLEDIFEDNSVDNIFIFHPDPWMKRRHNNRRVINDTLITLAHQKLKSTGKMYISTDVPSLWEYINGVINASNKFAISEDPVFWQEIYSTHWTDMCREQNRTIFYATFSPKVL